MALTGRTTEPNSRNRIAAIANSVIPIANGIRFACETRKSWPSAANPPTWTRSIGASVAGARTRGMTAVPVGEAGFSGEIASKRTVSPWTNRSYRAPSPCGHCSRGSA